LTVTTDIVMPQGGSRLELAAVSGDAADGEVRVAAEFFAAKLRHETDPSDVVAARAAGEHFILLDVRDAIGWDQGHIPGAVHMPAAEILGRLDELPPVDQDPRLVVYCWGPGCNGSTKAALVLAQAGYRNVREMIGGFEYWTREGLSIVTAAGRRRRPVDDLTGPLPNEPIRD
jgi:rhodanese-related sulfurtransferase